MLIFAVLKITAIPSKLNFVNPFTATTLAHDECSVCICIFRFWGNAKFAVEEMSS